MDFVIEFKTTSSDVIVTFGHHYFVMRTSSPTIDEIILASVNPSDDLSRLNKTGKSSISVLEWNYGITFLW